MKSVGIVTDSHSSISQEEAEKLGIFVVPSPFYIEETCFFEGVTLSREEFFKKQAEGAVITTSQPSLADMTGVWDRALSEYETILYMPISSGLSGSYEIASACAMDEEYEGKVLVVDHGQVASPLHLMILDALELVKKGYSAKEIKEVLEAGRERMMIYISVQTLEYLKKGGRITPAAAALGSVLQIKPVLKLAVGKLDSYKKCHGFHKARKAAIEALKEEINMKFADAYEAGAVRLLAASTGTDEENALWISELSAQFPGMPIFFDPLSLGVSCHVGPGAFGVGFSVKPEFGRCYCSR